MTSELWVHYLLTEGIDSVLYYVSVPFLFDLTLHMTDDHHLASAIPHFGIILATIAFGRLLGPYVASLSIADLRIHAVFLSILLFLLAACNNFAACVVLMFSKELLTSSLTSQAFTLASKTIITRAGNDIIASIPNLEGKLRRSLIVAMFAVLIGCILYNQSREVQFPAYFPYLFILFIWMILILTYYCFFSRSSRGKDLWNGKKTASSASLADLDSLNKSNQLSSSETLSIPPNFLAACKGNANKAMKMYEKALEWRRQHGVDHLLSRPQEHFEEILRLYPHAIHGRSKDGCVVLYEILGCARPKDLVKAGISMEGLIWHFNLRNEFVFQRIMVAGLDQHPVFGQVMTIVDIKGITLSDLSGSVISFIVKSSEIIDNYYPGCAPPFLTSTDL